MKVWEEEGGDRLASKMKNMPRPNEVGYLPETRWHYTDKLSLCYAELAEDILEDELIRICQNCGRLFIATNASQEYCEDGSCKTERDRKRKLKSIRNKQ